MPLYSTLPLFQSSRHEKKKESGLTPSPKLAFRFLYHDTSTAENAPQWMRTQYIKSGYRAYLRKSQIICSLFSLHNETLNIWTHLIGAVLFVKELWGLSVASEYRLRQPSELYCMQLFTVAAFCCFFFSTTYHLFNCHSEKVCCSLLQLDLSGIAILISGSFLAGVALGFKCSPFLKGLYLSFTGIICVSSLFAANCLKAERHHTLKVGIFVGAVVFGLVPAVHWFLLVPREVAGIFMVPLGMMFFYYGLGFCFWKYKIPERFLPGKFDIFFHSHQFWHVLVFLAAWEMYRGLLRYWQYISNANDLC